MGPLNHFDWQFLKRVERNQLGLLLTEYLSYSAPVNTMKAVVHFSCPSPSIYFAVHINYSLQLLHFLGLDFQ